MHCDDTCVLGIGVPLWWPGMLDLAQNIEVRECVAVRECSYERGYVLSCVSKWMSVHVCVCE